ncbi:MAG: D-tyrosyl-tRNA(Tyr) deacylase [Clostridiales bacterium]|nr:D-tyrosyl-tRNA(Tyr) deacylase [Clostridiales bacterium]
MKLVIQRVTRASVTVNKECLGKIDHGLVVLVGVGHEDTKEIVDKYVNKLIKLRIFADEEGKANLSLKDVGGQLLVISQFTLYANCKKGNRPSFIEAASPDKGEELYNYFVDVCRKYVDIVETGEFGADMAVELTNDGPFTIVLEEI